MSNQDNTSMLPYSSDYNTATGESSTESPSGSRELSAKQKTTLAMLSKHGFRLLPVNSMTPEGHCTCKLGAECPEKSRGKHPRILGWQDNATADFGQLNKWDEYFKHPNWALACGPKSGVWVLDIDNHKNGYESLARLEEKVGKLPETVRVKTGGGGLHIYFAWPTDGSLITNKVDLKEYEGIDVRGEGGYVVVPPALHRSGNRYEWIEGFDPDSIALAQAPQKLVDLICSAWEGSRSDKPRSTEPWEPMPKNAARRLAPEICARIRHFTGEQGARDVTYDGWVALASWGHAMTDDEGILQEWSAADPDRYKQRDTGRKWEDTADMAPRSCHRAQADHPLDECKNCPFFEMDKNPAYHVRMAYAREQGVKGPWGAPKSTDDKTIKTINKSSRKAYNEAGEGRMEAHNEVLTDRNTLIDVTEDSFEGEFSANGQAGQAGADAGAGGGQERAKFRIAADNITPLIEQSKAIEERLRNGEDPHDLMQEVARVLAAIKKLDSIRYDVEKDRLISAEGDARKKGQRAKYTSKKLDDAVKAVAEREAAELLTKTSTVGEVWPDAPEEHHELPLPSGYKYSEDGVEKFVATSQGNMGFEEVSSQPTYIAGWRKDITTSEIQAVIYTRTRDEGWKEITCAPSAFEDKRQVGSLKDIGCAFKDAAVFGEYLNEGYDLIRTRFGLEPELGTSRLGWHTVNDQLFFVFPEQSFGAMPIKLNGRNQQLKDDFSVKGDIVKEREALMETMFRYKKLAFAVGTAAASILMRPAKMSGFVDLFGFCSEYVSAQTNTGKSTTVSAAFSIYGTPHSIRNFNMTEFGGTMAMIKRSDLPNIWQEAQAGSQGGKGNKADPGVLLHILGDGGGKLMGTKDGDVRDNPQIFGTMLLANNENFVNSSTAKQGELQRIFSLDPPFPNPHEETRTKEERDKVQNDQEKMLQELSNNHGNGGRAMVQKLIEITDGSWTKLCEKVEADYRIQYEESTKKIPADIENHSLFNRRAKIVALVRVGLKYLIEYGYSLPEGVTSILFHGIDDAFVALIRDEQDNSDVKIEWKNYLGKIRDWLNTSMGRIHGAETKAEDGSLIVPRDGYIGAVTYIDNEPYICIQRTDLDKFLKHEYDKQLSPLLKAWIAAKIVTRGSDSQITKRVNYGSGPKEYLYGICFKVGEKWLDVAVPGVEPSAKAEHSTDNDDI